MTNSPSPVASFFRLCALFGNGIGSRCFYPFSSSFFGERQCSICTASLHMLTFPFPVFFAVLFFFTTFSVTQRRSGFSWTRSISLLFLFSFSTFCSALGGVKSQFQQPDPPPFFASGSPSLCLLSLFQNDYECCSCPPVGDALKTLATPGFGFGASVLFNAIHSCVGDSAELPWRQVVDPHRFFLFFFLIPPF